MSEYKEKWFIKLLKWLGIIKTYEVSKEEMCELAQSQCNHHCTYCAWNTAEKQEGAEIK